MYIYIYGVVHIAYVTEHFDFKNGTSLVFAGFLMVFGPCQMTKRLDVQPHFETTPRSVPQSQLHHDFADL